MRAALVDASARDELAPGPSRMQSGLGLICGVAASLARSWRRKGKDGGRGAEVAATACEAEAMRSSFEKPCCRCSSKADGTVG